MPFRPGDGVGRTILFAFGVLLLPSALQALPMQRTPQPDVPVRIELAAGWKMQAATWMSNPAQPNFYPYDFEPNASPHAVQSAAEASDLAGRGDAMLIPNVKADPTISPETIPPLQPAPSVVRYKLDGSVAAPSLKQGHDTTKPGDQLIAGRPVVRIGDVIEPTVRFYPADGAAEDRRGAPVALVLPGGGYFVLADDLEGTETVRWLNSIGVSALLLNYRVPSAAPHLEPLADARQALGLMCQRAAAWKLDLSKVFVVGFSAGADLAARLNHDLKIHPQPDACAVQLKGLMLIYPAYLSTAVSPKGVRPDVEPANDPPPAFLVQAEDDPFGAQNSIAFKDALLAHLGSAELHLFPSGGHGFGLRETSAPATHWIYAAQDWLRAHALAPQ